MRKNVKVDDNYYLVSESIENVKPVVSVKNTNHIFVVDVSGSMYYDLALIRTQLKNKLSNVMNEGDTISIIWFSGRHDAGILKENVEIKSLKTLTDLHNAIDKWLRPVGLTAFLKPLELVKDLVNRLKVERPDSSFSMIFLTDGYNNDCPWNEVISTLKSLENDISSSTFVEYGYYADTVKLTQMASILGGEKISCDGFDEFEPVFNDKISSSVYGGKKIAVQIPDTHLYDFAFSVDNGNVFLYNIQDGEILVNENLQNVYYFAKENIGSNVSNKDDEFITPLYGGIYVLADKLLNEDAEKLFYALGDNYHYQMLNNAFGKQKLNGFKSAIKECVSDINKRFPAGRNEIEKVDDNAYCLMNLISDLGDLDNCLFYPNHSSFTYNRIGRKKVNKGSDLSNNDMKKITEAKTVAEASKVLEELKETNIDSKFVNSNPERGYPLTDLVWNSERANLSVRIRIEGEVILPENKFSIDRVSSFKYNTFTLVKDGIVNVQKLPVSYSTELQSILDTNNVKYEIDTDLYNAKIDDSSYTLTMVIDLTSIPVINRLMVKSISANDLATQEWNLLKLQGAKKVYDFYRKSLFPKESKSYVEMLGQDAANWLKEIGITDYNGFNPKTEFEESKDFYMSVNLKTKVKGVSSLPKVDDVYNKIQKGASLKISETLLADAIIKYNEQLNSEMFKSLSEEQQKEMLKTYLINKTNELNISKRKVMQQIAQIKFALILSKKWFKEFSSFDENKLSIDLDEQNVSFTFDLSEKEVKV